MKISEYIANLAADGVTVKFHEGKLSLSGDRAKIAAMREELTKNKPHIYRHFARQQLQADLDALGTRYKWAELEQFLKPGIDEFETIMLTRMTWDDTVRHAYLRSVFLRMVTNCKGIALGCECAQCEWVRVNIGVAA